MKRIMIAIASLALLAGLASCQKEGTGKETAKQTEDVEIVQVNLTASFLKTRVSYAETDANNLQPSWEKGDEIFCTADGETFYKLTVDEVYSDGSAKISGQGPGNGPVALLYMNGLDSVTSLPLQISYDGQNGDEAMPNVLFASGTITDGTGTFEFKSFGSVVGVSYAKSLAGKNIKSVKIEGKDLSKANVTFENNAFKLTATANESDAITTADLSSKNITVKSNGEFIAPVFIAVPAGATISKVTVTSTDDVTDTKDLSSSPKTVEANQYLYVKVPAAPEAPEGAIANGRFTINPNGDQVFFSKGNLQAEIDATGAPTSWKFAANQYDYLGEGGANKAIGTAAGTVDLFGWSTVSTTYGISKLTSEGDYSGDFKDWGTAIDNKGTWRTLSMAEWAYLLGTALNSDEYYVPDKSTGVRYQKFGLGTVCDKIGMIILPDDWTKPSSIENDFVWTTLNDVGVPLEDDPFTQNVYDESQWAAMESAGVVFLPAAGYRTGSDVYHVGSGGRYWSGTASDEDNAYSLSFFSISVYPDFSYDRDFGYSVRLVSDCN